MLKRLHEGDGVRLVRGGGAGADIMDGRKS